VLIKAASGGGGRGMKVAESEDKLESALQTASSEAQAAFGDGAVYIEKYLGQPRHIEIQVIADTHGNVVHLGERDCSLQRRHQKVLEEAPSVALDEAARAKIGKTVTDAVKAIGYRGAGTVEFLYENGEFYFIEMNTRLQVEHPVTEAITRIDLVREQIRVAAGHELSFTQDDIKLEGWSIECRINAENPETFTPSPGTVTEFHAPGGLGVRLDSALYTGYKIPPYYDSMIGKLIVHGRDREEALLRLKRALSEMVVSGVETTIPLHLALLEEPAFLTGDYHIRWLESWLAEAPGLVSAEYLVMRGFGVEELLACYARGVFPMAESRSDSRVFLLEPDERGVIPLDRFHIPKSLKRIVRRDAFALTVNRCFETVVRSCAAPAPGREDSWINDQILTLYLDHARRRSRPFHRSVERRQAGGRALRGQPGRRVLWRKHVLA
jgi:acetyl/propionyl-CoA carboxylase alpha subunit